MGRAPVSNDDQRAAFAEHLHTVGQGLIVADQVDDDLGASLVREVHHLFHGVLPSVDDVVRAHSLGEAELALDDVGRDDVRVRHAP